MFAFRQDLHYHGFQAARKVWTPAVGYFLTERMECPHEWDSLFTVMYIAVEILQSKTNRGYNSQSGRKHMCQSLAAWFLITNYTSEIQINCSEG